MLEAKPHSTRSRRVSPPHATLGRVLEPWLTTNGSRRRYLANPRRAARSGKIRRPQDGENTCSTVENIPPCASRATVWGTYTAGSANAGEVYVAESEERRSQAGGKACSRTMTSSHLFSRPLPFATLGGRHARSPAITPRPVISCFDITFLTPACVQGIHFRGRCVAHALRPGCPRRAHGQRCPVQG